MNTERGGPEDWSNNGRPKQHVLKLDHAGSSAFRDARKQLRVSLAALIAAIWVLNAAPNHGPI
jgi:hypothetical protein